MGAVGAVVLAGGRSSRMGRSKAGLEWHGSTLLRRVAGVVARAVDGPVLVVAAAGQLLPPLPPTVRVVEDGRAEQGPLQGIADGLAALGDDIDRAFVCATDMPFLHPAFVRQVVAGLDRADVALPVVGGFRQPLAAAYRRSLAPTAAVLLARGERRPAALLAACTVQVLDEQALLNDERLRAVDPLLESVAGLNDPQEYASARARPAPGVVVRVASGETALRAATLGAAARSVGLVVDRHLLAALDADQVVRDPETPLVQGDVVTFLSADPAAVPGAGGRPR